MYYDIFESLTAHNLIGSPEDVSVSYLQDVQPSGTQVAVNAFRPNT